MIDSVYIPHGKGESVVSKTAMEVVQQLRNALFFFQKKKDKKASPGKAPASSVWILLLYQNASIFRAKT